MYLFPLNSFLRKNYISQTIIPLQNSFSDVEHRPYLYSKPPTKYITLVGDFYNMNTANINQFACVSAAFVIIFLRVKQHKLKDFLSLRNQRITYLEWQPNRDRGEIENPIHLLTTRIEKGRKYNRFLVNDTNVSHTKSLSDLRHKH